MLYDVSYYYFITVKCVYIYSILVLFISFILPIFLFFQFLFLIFISIFIYLIIFIIIIVFLFYVIFSQGITRMNSHGAVGDILVFTFINLSDNTVYTQNRKYRYSEQ